MGKITYNPELTKKEMLDRMIKLVNPRPSDLVLDIGTGKDGSTALAIAPHVKEVLTVDIEPKVIELFKKILEQKKKEGISNVKAELMSVDELENLPSDYFDIVTCRAAFHHFPNPKIVLSQIYRILKKKGKYEMMDPFFSATIKETWTAITRMKELELEDFYTFEEYIEMVSDAGFEIVSVIPFKFRRFFSDWIRTADERVKERLKRAILKLPPSVIYDGLRLQEITREMNGKKIEDLEWTYNCFELLAVKG